MRAYLSPRTLLLAVTLVALCTAGCKSRGGTPKAATATAVSSWQPVALEGPEESYVSSRGTGTTSDVFKDSLVVSAMSTSQRGAHAAGVKLPLAGSQPFQLQMRFVHPECIKGMSLVATDDKDQVVYTWETTSFGGMPAGVLQAWTFDPGAAAPGFFTFRRAGRGTPKSLHVVMNLTGEQKPAGFSIGKFLVSSAKPSSASQKAAGPAPVIVSFGPNVTRAGEIFNASGGQASLWFTCKNATKDTEVTWNEKSLSTVFGNPELVTAAVPTEFYVKPGSYTIGLRNRATGQVSNTVIFTVTP